MIEYENLSKLNAPFFDEFKRSFESTLHGGWYVLGRNVVDFEQGFSDYVGVKHGIGVASGLDALLLALVALDLECGAEVIVPSNTYIATIIAIINAGLRPVLVEPDLTTYNIAADRIESAITDRTRAIMVVHLYGKVCDMDPIVALCQKHDLRLVEDCAQAHGAMYKGQHAGSFGDFGCFSFYPTKNLGALGDAGAIVCKDQELADKVRVLRNYGSVKKYHNDVAGYNSRLDEIQAGFLNIKLKALDEINDHKRLLASLYLQSLDDKFIKPVVHQDFKDVYHIFNIRHRERDKLRAHLLDHAIQTEIHYPIAPHQQKAMQGKFDSSFPISSEIHETTLSLPISFFHTEEDVIRICEVINSFG